MSAVVALPYSPSSMVPDMEEFELVNEVTYVPPTPEETREMQWREFRVEFEAMLRQTREYGQEDIRNRILALQSEMGGSSGQYRIAQDKLNDLIRESNERPRTYT